MKKLIKTLSIGFMMFLSFGTYAQSFDSTLTNSGNIICLEITAYGTTSIIALPAIDLASTQAALTAQGFTSTVVNCNDSIIFGGGPGDTTNYGGNIGDTLWTAPGDSSWFNFGGGFGFDFGNIDSSLFDFGTGFGFGFDTSFFDFGGDSTWIHIYDSTGNIFGDSTWFNHGGGFGSGNIDSSFFDYGGGFDFGDSTWINIYDSTGNIFGDSTWFNFGGGFGSGNIDSSFFDFGGGFDFGDSSWIIIDSTFIDFGDSTGNIIIGGDCICLEITTASGNVSIISIPSSLLDSTQAALTAQGITSVVVPCGTDFDLNNDPNIGTMQDYVDLEMTYQGVTDVITIPSGAAISARNSLIGQGIDARIVDRSIQKISKITDLSIYPNPSRAFENVMVAFESNAETNITLSVVNNIGQNVMTIERFAYEGVNRIEVSNDNLPSGLYFINISNQSGMHVTKKLIVE